MVSPVLLHVDKVGPEVGPGVACRAADLVSSQLSVEWSACPSLLLCMALRGSTAVTPSGLPKSCRAGRPWLTDESHAGHMDWGGGQVGGEHLIDINTCRVMRGMKMLC